MSKQEVQLTTKSLGIDDLKNTDHVGFVTDYNNKGYIIAHDNKFRAIKTEEGITVPNHSWGTTGTSNLKDIFSQSNAMTKITAIYRFDTRKELYQWLAE
jgi:hypothetical protein